MKFRKRIKVFPGFHLNISASGISSTIGVKGASINFSKRGTYLNTSIPELGLYNRQRIDGSSWSSVSASDTYPVVEAPLPLAGEIRSASLEELSSTTFKELKETLHEVYKDRIELSKEIDSTKFSIRLWTVIRILSFLLVVGFFIPWFKRKLDEQEEYLSDLEDQLIKCKVDIDTHFDQAFSSVYSALVERYKALITSRVIWDITSSVQLDTVKTRSAASQAVTRTPVSFTFDNIDIIRSEKRAFHFENKNGGDLYIYPAFVVMTTNQKTFAIIDINDFKINVYQQQFLEEGTIPSDTRIVGKTWKKVNKNGTPDKRFKENYEIPIVRYAGIEIRSETGLNEEYAVSSYEKAEEFINTLIEYQRRIRE